IKTIESSGWIFRGDEKLAAEPGTRLFSGDLLQTGPQGAMGIILRDNTLISMGPDSELVLNEFIFEPREGRFSLIAEMAKGTFSFLSGMIGKLSPESARIDTPVGTVGIRGTRFFAKVEGSR
ncbi:MAG: FecR family protein, partial [Thermodesulfobacteriota bacterium]